MTPSPKDKILTRADRGEPVAKIADALDLSPGYIYGVLRAERPKRARKPRQSTSDMPRMIRGLKRAGLKPARIAHVLKITRQYVHRVLSEG